MTDHPNLQIEERPQALVAYLSGRINAMTVPELQTELENLLGDRCRLVLEMSAVEFMSSAGLWLLYNLQRQLPVGGRLVLANLSDQVRTTLDLVGFQSVLRTYPDLDQAIVAVGGERQD